MYDYDLNDKNGNTPLHLKVIEQAPDMEQSILNEQEEDIFNHFNLDQETILTLLINSNAKISKACFEKVLSMTDEQTIIKMTVNDEDFYQKRDNYANSLN